MIVRDTMTTAVALLDPKMTLRSAATMMRTDDIGAIPVAENDRLVGMLTDRDIVCRGVADGLDVGKATVDQVMSQKLLYCYDDQAVTEVAENMAQNKVRRLPVVDRNKQLVGIISLGDLSQNAPQEAFGEALQQISQPSP